VLSNLGLRHALAAAGIGVIETPVGDRHVSDALEAKASCSAASNPAI